jgi:predicted HD superfamily hydrolase involved in NAD metabolism
MDIINNKVEEKLGKKRYKHSLRVLKTALELGKTYGEKQENIEVAALLHDYAKELTLDEAYKLMKRHGISADKNPIISLDLIHGELASLIAKDEFGIEDIDIINAIKYHTTGRAGMSRLEKIIYLADTIEPARDFENLGKIRQTAHVNLDKAVLMAMDSTLEYLIKTGETIDTDTIDARNYIIREINKRLIDEEE